jgi:hypothetical protein
MKLNQRAVKHAKKLIKDGKYVVESDWSEAQPSADQENKFLDKHDWSDYGDWHLGFDTDENDDTKGYYKFVYGDLKKVHRSGVIAAKQRAAQNHYDEIEKAADGLLEMINELEGITA